MVSLPSVPQNLDEFEAVLRETSGSDQAPSVAYGISRRGETVISGAFGFADRERTVLATIRTPYQLASITKPLTATVLAILAERGVVHLDEPINSQLSGIKIQSRTGNADQVTVRQVADHSSGLPTHYQFYYGDEPSVRPSVETQLRRFAKTFTSPGERHVYSNLGYGLLEFLLEQVSGLSLAELMKGELFDPLGMVDASLGNRDSREVAVSYGPDGVPYPPYDFDHRGGSAAFASVADLLAFGEAHLGFGPSILSPGGLADAHRATSYSETQAVYGLGWGIRADRHGYRSISHTGYMGGVSTAIRLIPELDLTIVILTNGQSDLPMMFTDYAVSALSQEYRNKLVPSLLTPATPLPMNPVPERLFGTWSGSVETESGHRLLELEITSSNTAIVHCHGTVQDVQELHWRSGRIFGMFDADLEASEILKSPYRIHLDLSERSDSLSGVALTMTTLLDGPGGAPGKRFGNALGFWTELKRPNL